MPISLTVDWSQLKGAADFIRAERLRFRAGIKEDAKTFQMDWIKTVKNNYLEGPAPHKLRRKSGLLQTSIMGNQIDDGDDFFIIVGTPVWYGKLWELGKKTKKGIDKRPFLSPAREDEFPGLEKMIEKRIREVRLVE